MMSRGGGEERSMRLRVFKETETQNLSSRLRLSVSVSLKQKNETKLSLSSIEFFSSFSLLCSKNEISFLLVWGAHRKK